MGCIDSQQQQTPNIPRSRPKSSQKNKKIRILTKFADSQIRQISDEERKAGFRPVYSCPICFLRFNKILACEQCNNYICHKCYLTYERKAKTNFKCSFCQSQTSIFKDYQGQAHSYFDATGKNGFLTAQQRNKIDQQIRQGKGQGQGSKLQRIQQVEAN